MNTKEKKEKGRRRLSIEDRRWIIEQVNEEDKGKEQSERTRTPSLAVTLQDRLFDKLVEEKGDGFIPAISTMCRLISGHRTLRDRVEGKPTRKTARRRKRRVQDQGSAVQPVLRLRDLKTADLFHYKGSNKTTYMVGPNEPKRGPDGSVSCICFGKERDQGPRWVDGDLEVVLVARSCSVNGEAEAKPVEEKTQVLPLAVSLEGAVSMSLADLAPYAFGEDEVFYMCMPAVKPLREGCLAGPFTDKAEAEEEARAMAPILKHTIYVMESCGCVRYIKPDRPLILTSWRKSAGVHPQG